MTEANEQPGEASEVEHQQPGETSGVEHQQPGEASNMGNEQEKQKSVVANNSTQWRPSTVLSTIREDPRYHWAAFAVACVVGLLLATFHWSGIVIGGALVGVLATNLKRAVLSGLGFGILVVLVWAALIQLSGSFEKVSVMNEIALLPVGIGLGLAILGSLLRGALS